MTRRRNAFAAPTTLLIMLLTGLLTGVLSIALAGPAAAGGPTSVLLVVPGAGRTASLYTGSADYAELATLVGAYDPAPATSDAPPGTADATSVTVTWLIHDVQVWRVDRVEFTLRGPSVVTQVNPEGGSIWDVPAVRHTPTESKALTVLLDRLGVGPDGFANGRANGSPAPAATAGQDPGGNSGPAWVWGAAGTLVGAVLTLAARRRPRPRRERREPDDGTPTEPDDGIPAEASAGGTRVEILGSARR